MQFLYHFRDIKIFFEIKRTCTVYTNTSWDTLSTSSFWIADRQNHPVPTSQPTHNNEGTGGDLWWSQAVM